MIRREYQHRVRCAQAGCLEVSFRVYETRTEEREGHQRQQRTPWRCSRHDRPDEVLRPDNTAVQHVLIASRVKASGRYSRATDPGYLDGLYWLPEGVERGGSGFTFGPGFKAHADDFPEGTRLVVTAYVETPVQATVAAEIDAAGGE